MYGYLHLRNCANATKKYMRAYHTHIYICSLSHKCAITHTRVTLLMHSLTHLCTHSLSYPFTHILTFSLNGSLTYFHSLNLILSLLVTSMLIQANSILLMHILTLTHNYMYTRTDSIMRSYNACTHALTYTQSVCACVILGTRVCTLACVIKQMM